MGNGGYCVVVDAECERLLYQNAVRWYTATQVERRIRQSRAAVLRDQILETRSALCTRNDVQAAFIAFRVKEAAYAEHPVTRRHLTSLTGATRLSRIRHG